MVRPNYYKALEVDPKADVEVIDAAYEALAKKHKDNATVQRLLEEAKSILTHKVHRETYDAELTPKGKRVIGEYRILEKLAEGGFGITYKAEHIRLGTPVCIKHAINISASDEKILLEEARNIWDLRHWGIPAIRDILTMPDGSLSLVMSFVPGKTIAEIIQRQKELDPETVAWIADRMLNILRYLHLNGRIHGDVKPQNVIVQEEDHTVVMVDYGLSQLKPNNKTESKGYTPFFAAPEQRESKPLIPESDLFGLGMTMIYALGGDVEHSKISSDTPKPMQEFIKNLIRRDPMSRPRVWNEVDLCEEIKKMRLQAFGRTACGSFKF